MFTLKGSYLRGNCVVLRRGLLVILDEGEALGASAWCSVEKRKCGLDLVNKTQMKIEQDCFTHPPPLVLKQDRTP